MEFAHARVPLVTLVVYIFSSFFFPRGASNSKRHKMPLARQNGKTNQPDTDKPCLLLPRQSNPATTSEEANDCTAPSDARPVQPKFRLASCEGTERPKGSTSKECPSLASQCPTDQGWPARPLGSAQRRHHDLCGSRRRAKWSRRTLHGTGRFVVSWQPHALTNPPENQAARTDTPRHMWKVATCGGQWWRL